MAFSFFLYKTSEVFFKLRLFIIKITPCQKKHGNSNLSKHQLDLSDLTNYQKNYSIKKYEGTTYLVIDYQYISANGNVINNGCESYDLMDEYTLGNVQEQSIEEIYIKDKSKKLVLK